MKLKSFIKKAQAAQIKSVKRVSVGFFATSKYRDGTPVTNVAAWNEFGTQRNGKQHSPPRPFMRTAVKLMESQIPPVVKAHLDPETLSVTPTIAGLIGQKMQAAIQSTIRYGSFEENAPSTRERKRTKAIKATGQKEDKPGYEIARPLIDEGLMRKSVTYKVYYTEGDDL